MPRLSQELARTPRPVEAAVELDVDEQAVHEALSADGCFTPASLDVRCVHGKGSPLGELLHADGGDVMEAAVARTVVVPALRRLSPRDCRIVVLRYYHGLTQTEIAGDVGISQMQVSRVLQQALQDLRLQVA